VRRYRLARCPSTLGIRDEEESVDAAPSGRWGLVVAIDGPSGSGKSTVARAVAHRLGLRYLDTGAVYRAATWAVLRAGVAPDDADAVTAVVAKAAIDVTTSPDTPVVVQVDGHDVSRDIRGEAVTAAVSAVSAVPAVRALLVTRQRAIAGTGDVVIEGRDIGTVVAPDAPIKVFLTADPEARAARRSAELVGPAVDAATVARTAAALRRRDTADSSRPTSPLTQAPDAVVIDSTALGVDEVVERVVRLAERVGAR
jgi:cytidylate kinase